jgi:hypothetical protein
MPEINTLFAQNVGTVAMLLLVAATIVIRQRHFTAHGKDALLVVALFVLFAAGTRWVSLNQPEWVSGEHNRLLNGLAAIVCAVIQVTTLFEAELEIHARKMRERGIDLLEVLK